MLNIAMFTARQPHTDLLRATFASCGENIPRPYDFDKTGILSYNILGGRH